MSTSVASASDLRWYQGIERNLWIILAVTYVGWLLDSMDLNLFTVVLVPSLRDLLGPQASPQMIGYYGGSLPAVRWPARAGGRGSSALLCRSFGRPARRGLSIPCAP